jgi:tripartite-type tricarboxylate transporter receptor subunit TctC
LPDRISPPAAIGWAAPRRGLRAAALVVLAWLGLAAPASFADPVADFYAGKRVMLVVATPPGGPYDICARLLARHLGRHISGNPVIAVENMPGATGALAADYVYNKAPQDGTILANLHNMLPLLKALGQMQAKLDPAKFNWLGNMTREVGDAIVSTRSAVKTIDDARRIAVVMGAASPMALAAIYPRVMNHVLGTKFRVITGYGGFAGVQHAIEQGEVEGNAGDTWYSGQGRTYEWFEAGTIRILVQIGARSPDLPDVPLLVDLAGNDADRQLLELFSSPYTIGKPTAVGPEVPPERVAALGAAYAATMDDPAFLADARRLGVAIAPVSGRELADLVRHLTTLPPALVERARAAIAP